MNGRFSADMRLAARHPTQARCKCCGENAVLAGFIDFARDCYGYNRQRSIVSGIPVPYYRCAACEFGFTDAFDAWRADEFAEHIYNADYPLYDPRYDDARPRKMAGLISNVMKNRNISVLDYGGGNGKFAQLLREAGFREVDSYDPFHENPVKPRRVGYQLVTCIEVAEHSTDPLALFDELQAYAAPTGLILFSTQDFSEVHGYWLDDWYVAPRNGHVSFFTQKTMRMIADRLGRDYHKLDKYRHVLTPRMGSTQT